MNQDNYVSGTTKLFANADRLLEFKERNILRPVTLDVSPTNACNLNCSFCSVKNRDLTEELLPGNAIATIHKYMELGIKSVVLTGGGEPTLWSYFDGFVKQCKDILNLKLGLITNGLKLHEIDPEILGRFDWIRVSLNGLDVGLEPDLSTIPYSVDLSLNYVWHSDSVFHLQAVGLQKILNQYPKVSVLKIQKDIFGDDLSVPPFEDERVFISEKDDHSSIPKICYMGWVKPHLDANGEVYRCVCSAFEGRKLDPKHLMPIDPKRTPDINMFSTHLCQKCFFYDQNELIRKFIQKNKHDDFI